MGFPLLGAGIGAGVGLASSLFAGRPRPNRYSAAYNTDLMELRRRNMAETTGGPPPEWLTAQQNLGEMSDIGMMGARARSGDPGAMAGYMNPYESTMNPMWDQLRAGAGTDADLRATAQNAGWGSRAAIERGARVGAVDVGQAGQRYGEFGNAMGRAGEDARMGYGAMMGAREFDWGRRNTDINSQTAGFRPDTTMQQPGPNWFSSMVGGAAAGMGAQGSMQNGGGPPMGMMGAQPPWWYPGQPGAGGPQGVWQ